MRDVKEFSVDIGSVPALNTGASKGTRISIFPARVQVHRIACFFSIPIDTVAGEDLTLDVLIDGVDSGIDIAIPDTTVKGSFTPDAELFLEAGQTLSLESNGEPTGATVGYFNAVVIQV